MRTQHKQFFGKLFVNIFNKSQLIKKVEKILSTELKNPKSIIYINSGSFYYREKLVGFDKAIRSSDYIRISGFFLRFLVSVIYKVSVSKIKTEDFINELFELGQEQKFKIFLLGSDHATLNKALRVTKKRFSKLQILGHHGYFNKTDNEKVVKMINKINPKIIIVGLGSGKQEVWVYRNKNKFKKVKLIFTVGNFIDIIGGKDNVPPKVLRRIGMEWLYRIIREPKRLGIRYLVGFWLTIKYLFK